MQFFKDIWDGLAVIGLMTVLYGCHFAWRQIKRAGTSAKQSQQTHQNLIQVQAVEDRDEIGI